MKRSLLIGAAVASMLSCGTGCFPWLLDDDDDDPPSVPVERPADPPPEANSSPQVTVEIADWPPPGPETPITIALFDDSGLAEVDLQFKNSLTFEASGVRDEIVVTGQELGEGLGYLNISAFDARGARTESYVADLLIDLSPPEITLGDTVVRHADDSDVEIWVADAWILGSVELTVGEVTVTHDFEDGYPSTLGESWDHSLVQFSSTAFPEGTSPAVVTLYDAAGNVAETELELTLDGHAPLVAITSPAPATVVTGAFDVTVDASDEGGGPVWIELRVEGTPVATAVGPTATVQLDAADLTPGDVELQAVATDLAGNESLIAAVPITVQ
jgi:hypothetical protein